MDDWEVVDDSSSSIGNSITYLDEIEGDSDGIIRSDYFSLDSSHTKYVVEDQVSVESDNPILIDPVVSDTTTKPIGEIWTSSGSDDGSYVVESEGNESDIVEIEERNEETEKLTEKKRVSVWCKLPLDLLKYWLFKTSPVWSLSIAAAAIMGVVILRRRLYKMKQKTRILHITMDHKVMTAAARLNEAFTVAKKAPIIRPSLPGIGIAPWPVMALR